ncbi:MAG: chitinase [bacterium]
MTDVSHFGPTQRISPARLLFVLLVVGGAIAAGGWWLLGVVNESRAEVSKTWSAPYVDVTLTPQLHFEDATEQPAHDVVLGFVVADPAKSCEPSWGTYYTLDAASRALDLDRRIVRLRERGGDAMVSFGGALNNELATVCRDPDALVAAYQSVIDRYKLGTIEFDIEGAALADSAANQRRSAAIAKLQQKNEGLAVWFTLPVAPTGLTDEGLKLLQETLQGGATVSGVNVMTMNYGGARTESMSMRDATVSALTSTWQQLGGLFAQTGQPRADEQIWAMIGATPMIGQNDVSSDVFTTADANGLVDFARTVSLGRLSFWSANRDISCGAVVEGKGVSNTCSGVNQEPLEFTRILAGGPSRLDGKPPATTPVPSSEPRVDGLTRDDPRTSPYPIWRAAKAYDEGAKVVWQGRVYQAKWWTLNNQPDAPVKHIWETPWRYLGPVLESDRVAVRAGTATDGSRPRWSAESVFVAGDEVEYSGKAFKAKWWTQGEAPQEDPDQPYDHPWEYLGEVAPKTK